MKNCHKSLFLFHYLLGFFDLYFIISVNFFACNIFEFVIRYSFGAVIPSSKIVVNYFAHLFIESQMNPLLFSAVTQHIVLFSVCIL